MTTGFIYRPEGAQIGGELSEVDHALATSFAGVHAAATHRFMAEGGGFRGAVVNALRNDSKDLDDGDPFTGYRFDHYARRVRGDSSGYGRRTDSQGVHFARDLEYIRKTVIEEKMPLLNGLLSFPVSTEVPIGARSHTIRRGRMSGEATIYRDGSRIPVVGVSSDEETFPVRYIAVAWTQNYFDTQASDYAGSNVLGRKMRAARRVIEERENRLIWYGDPAHGLYGVLNHPYLDKQVSAVAFDGTETPDDVIAELNRATNYATNASRAVFSPNRMRTSPRIKNYLMTTRLGTAVTDTIGKWWLANNGRITAIDEAHELQGVGPGGTDALLFYRDDADSIKIEKVGGLTTLPVKRDDFVDSQVMFQGYAGVTMIDSGNNILVWATGPVV